MSEMRSGSNIGEVPPHPVLLPEGRRDAQNSPAAQVAGVLSPLGERDRVRGDFAKHSTGLWTPMTQTQLLAAAEEKQRRAADPAVSAWVRANAGTGKTHVLVQRILRLLLTGAEPRSILCLTFTKNAAAEMEARVLAKLGEWATASDANF